jgi:phosphatidylglycerol:prolipoprotein diacylglycerol transferase
MPWLYQLIMAAAIAAGLALSRLSRQKLALSERERIGIALGAFIGAMLGAKLPFALTDWEGLLTGTVWFGDGKTILTGLAGGYLGVVVAKWSLGIRTRTGDSFAVPVAGSIAVGRLGCFVAGCCYGRPTSLPWGTVFPQVDALPRHPAQLYESAFHAISAMVLFQLERRGLFRGNLIKLYIMAYALFRFATEFLRDEQPLWLDLTGYQWGALAMFVLFGFLTWHDSRVMRNGQPAMRDESVPAPGIATASLSPLADGSRTMG